MIDINLDPFYSPVRVLKLNGHSNQRLGLNNTERRLDGTLKNTRVVEKLQYFYNFQEIDPQDPGELTAGFLCDTFKRQGFHYISEKYNALMEVVKKGDDVYCKVFADRWLSQSEALEIYTHEKPIAPQVCHTSVDASIIRMYELGKKSIFISRNLGVSYITVRRVIKRYKYSKQKDQGRIDDSTTQGN